MDIKKIIKKPVIIALTILILLIILLCFGFIVSKFNKNGINNFNKNSKSLIIYAAYPDKSAYYSYSAFEEKIYGPFEMNNVKNGDYYIKIGTPQGSGGFSSFRLFDKDKKLIKIDENNDNACAFGKFLYSNGRLYMENSGELYRINPDINFACFPLLDEEYEKLSVKRIFLDSIKDADTINVNKYNYFYFDKFITPNYLNGVHKSPKKGEKLEYKINFKSADNKYLNIKINIINTF